MHHGWICMLQTKWSFIHSVSELGHLLSEAWGSQEPVLFSNHTLLRFVSTVCNAFSFQQAEATEKELMFLLRYLKRIRILNVRLSTVGNASRKHLFYFCH